MSDSNRATTYSNAGLTTFSLFGFPDKNRWWAFQQMGLARPHLNKVPGLLFYKLMGAGNGRGFSLQPDFNRYGIIAVWKDAESADQFFRHAQLMNDYRDKTSEIWNCSLLPISAHGLWSGVNPFQNDSVREPDASSPVAILTRAAIRPTKLIRFWQHVPETSRAIASASGLLESIGVGEIPFIRQATVSFWKDMESAQSFAYRNEVHKEVVKKTREEKWYKEELFARFSILDSSGSWNGKNPLASHGTHLI